MDYVETPIWLTVFAFAVVLVKLSWYLGVGLALWMIWRKVRHLPG